MKWLLSLLVAGTVFSANVVFAQEAVIAQGKRVKFDYTLTVDGQKVDSSEGKAPLEYVQGEHMIIPGLEKALEGLKAGDMKSVTVAPEEAYGPVSQEAFLEFPKEQLGLEGTTPQKGMIFNMTNQEGQTFPAAIEEIRDTTVLLNFNHPMAGKTLTFDVTIVSIE